MSCLAYPWNPTASQREDRRAGGHLPYTTLCEECVAARATGEPHRKRRCERIACVFFFDYLYLSKSELVLSRSNLDDAEEIGPIILVAKDLGIAIFANVVPQKGIDQEHSVLDLLVEDIQWLGY